MRLPWGTSEVELINVILREYHDVTEHHVVANDGLLAKSTGLDRCCAILDFPCRQCLRDVNCQIAQINGIPQDDRSDSPVVHKLFHVVWRRKTGDQHLPALATLLNGLSGSGKRNSADSEDPFEIRVFADHIPAVCQSVAGVFSGLFDRCQFQF